MSDIGFYKRLAEQRKNTALELYDKLDNLKQQRDDLLEACRQAFNESHNPKVEKILEAAIAKCEA